MSRISFEPTGGTILNWNQKSPDQRPTILVVDDTAENLTVMGGLLRSHYRVRVASSGEDALRLLSQTSLPDLILLDVMMPGLDGYGVLQRLREDERLRDIPVIFVTAMDADEDEQHGLNLGAVDYVTKPIRPAILQARVEAQLELKRARDWLRDQNGYLEREVRLRMRENELVKDLSLRALATLAEARDNETGQHLVRTSTYVELVGGALRQNPVYGEVLTQSQLELIVKATPLHDIGKVGIPDHILLKPGKLTSEEFVIMRTHAQIGADSINLSVQRAIHDARVQDDQQFVRRSLDFLHVAGEIAGGHHEKWDGSGYPKGLRGVQIPLSARLMALADVYDALSCRRVYKPPFERAEVEKIIRQGRATHFDPAVVDAWESVAEQFAEIAVQLSD